MRAPDPEGPLEIRADLVVGADGRHSTVRDAAACRARVGAPMDVLWFRLPRRPSDPGDTVGRSTPAASSSRSTAATTGSAATSSRKARWTSCAAEACTAFRTRRRHRPVRGRQGRRARELGRRQAADRCRGPAAALAPPGPAVHRRRGPHDVAGRRRRHQPRVQDAVAAANLLAGPLREGRLTEADLAAVQRRREMPARVTQRLQVLVQNRVITRVLGREGPIKPRSPSSSSPASRACAACRPG